MIEHTGNRKQNVTAQRDKILNTARELIEEGGIDALSMRELAKRADISSRTPYNLFQSKGHLMFQLLLNQIRPLADILFQSAATPDLLSIEIFIDRARPLIESKEEYIRTLLYGVITQDSLSNRAQSLDDFNEMAVGIVNARVAAGDLQPDTPIKQVARHHVLSMASLGWLWVNADITLAELDLQLKYHTCQLFYPYAEDATLPRLKQRLKEVNLELQKIR